MSPAHEIVRTNEPAPYALRRMSATAIATADTPAFREWASRLATRAPPRDYVEQLKQLYDGILKRWRYVMEREEWIHGTPDSLIGTVLGLKYNTDTQPALADIDRAPSAEKGFGDCDDVATVVAAGVLALGMKAAFAVGVFKGGAHVWVLATTPRGEKIHIDPVGHPENKFGWHLPGQFHVIPIHGKTSKPMGTYFGNVEQGFKSKTQVPHWCMVHPNDCAGGRVLSVPMRESKLLLAGIGVDGTPAVDQYGHMYEYVAGLDLWRNIQVGDMGRIGRRGRGRRKKRRAARRKLIRRVAAKAVGGRAGQLAVGAALQSVGIPRRLTAGVMQAAASLIKNIGIRKFVRLIRTDRRRAAQLAAQAAKAGLRRAAMSGHDERHVVQQSGVSFAAQPVEAIVGIPGLYAFGALEVASVPTPGQWYRIQKGDTLFGVTSTAFGVGSGSERLKLARMINDAAANQVYVDPALADNLFKGGRISFRPRYSDDAETAIDGGSGSSYAVIWLPVTAGDEPPTIEEDEPVDEVIPLPEPEPTPPAVVPEPPIEPEPVPEPAPPAIVIPPEPEPEPPAPPIEPAPAPSVPDEPEPPVTPPVEPIVGPVPGYTIPPAVTPPPPPYRPVPTPPAAQDCPPGFEPDPTGAGDCRRLPGAPSITPSIVDEIPMPPPDWQPTRPPDYPSAPPFAPAPAPAPTPYDPNYPQQQQGAQQAPIGIGLAFLLLDLLG